MMSCFYKFEYGEAECRTIYVVNTNLTIVTFSKETYLTQMNERNIPFKGHRTMKDEPQSAYSKFPRSFTLLGPVSCKMKDNGNILVSTSKVKTLITISPLCYPYIQIILRFCAIFFSLLDPPHLFFFPIRASSKLSLNHYPLSPCLVNYNLLVSDKLQKLFTEGLKNGTKVVHSSYL